MRKQICECELAEHIQQPELSPPEWTMVSWLRAINFRDSRMTCKTLRQWTLKLKKQTNAGAQDPFEILSPGSVRAKNCFRLRVTSSTGA